MMRWLGKSVLALAIASIATGGVALALQPDDEVVELLSGISYSPNKNKIDQVIGPDSAVELLISIAEDEEADADPGLRLRALRALGEYALSADKGPAIDALHQQIESLMDATMSSGGAQLKLGVELLYLRAAMLSLAELEGANSVTDLIPLLDHPSRDVRAACAQALGITGSSEASQPLLDRALVEQQQQVQLAIADALFELNSSN